MSRPLAIDLYAGLFGWSEGLVAEGWQTVGIDLEDMRGQFGFDPLPHTSLIIQDVRTISGAAFEQADLIVASPPCFVAETLILTARGLIPIRDVVGGDSVLTHRNRWRRVLWTGSNTASTVIVSGHGAMLEGTAEHPIYTRRNTGGMLPWKTGQAWPTYQPKTLDPPTWTPLAKCLGHHWASPIDFEPMQVPSLPNGLPDTPGFWWMVGRWVGDGWLRRRGETGRGDEVIICCANAEADDLERRLSFAPKQRSRAAIGELHWRRSSGRTVTKLHAASNALAEWLAIHFGVGAGSKSWPAWALGMNQLHRQALLDGYVSADGCTVRNGREDVIQTTTVSKALAVSTRLLAASLGNSSRTSKFSRPSTCVIEGRTVCQKDTWTVQWRPGANRLVEHAYGMQWGCVRRVAEGSTAQVWNLEVDEDNSYVADGIVVHNCQKYSYMAMPWTRSKALAQWYRDPEHPERIVELNDLFNACFRIQAEASAAKGEHIPLIVENVRGAIPWVGRSRWHFGSFHLWGDVPALMPSRGPFKSTGMNWSDQTKRGQDFTRVAGGQAMEAVGRKLPGFRFDGSGRSFQSASVEGTKASARKMASAMIARIPPALSRHIGRTFYPQGTQQMAAE